MRNQRQDRPPLIVSPVPAHVLPQAARLWWASFGTGRGAPPRMRADHGIVALDAQGRVAGVMGLRDARGGFPARVPWAARIGFRAGPPTADLIVDGIAVRDSRCGIGRALVRAAMARARAAGHPGLRAEVRAGDAGAVAFYRALGFATVASLRFGWPWTGRVLILRRAVDAAAAEVEMAPEPEPYPRRAQR